MEDSSKNIYISLGDAKSNGLVQEKPTPAEELSTYTASCGTVDNLPKPVYIHEQAMKRIEEHAASSPSCEVGGVLLGGIYQAKGVHYVRIDEYLRAQNAAEKRSELTFTHETWSQLNAERERRFPNLRIVGWYHTHPRLGVFMSERDLFIHKNFFNEESLVAYVVDPVESDRAFFQWSEGKLVRLSGFYIFGDGSNSRDVEALAKNLVPRPREIPQASGAPSTTPTEVRVIFREPCINLYYALPRFLRVMLGISDPRTSPRLSIKTMFILVLLAALLFQSFSLRQARNDIAVEQAKQYVEFGDSLYNIQAYEEALADYRRAQVLDPKNADCYFKQLIAAAGQTDVSDRDSVDRLSVRVGTVIREASQQDAGIAVDVVRKVQKEAIRVLGSQQANELSVQVAQASDQLQLDEKAGKDKRRQKGFWQGIQDTISGWFK